ncbi:MAG: tRNA guanosine(34) transglycosylase Tgt [Candidatus Izimaplasma sp.]|nr:tRNA guanosine(34) transglycosylase Tgt [Candidatus Izimaplasma bacterium]
MFNYKLLKEEKDTGARLGKLYTEHGVFETPIFMPVGTKATVKTLENNEIKEVSDGLILGNTYHLWLQPGDDIVKEQGGIRGFMKWDQALLTDSGGYQVFSLSDNRTITEEGVEFRHHKSGERLFMRPEDSIHIQNNLGADIIMSFDECPPFDADYNYMKQSVERTTRWAKRGKKAHQKPDKQALFGIVQGGPFKELRHLSAQSLIDMDFDGYSIGGLSVGETKTEMYNVLDDLKDVLPKQKPRYLMGVGTPDDIIEGVIRGIDMFDCVNPTRLARHGSAMTSRGRVRIKNKVFENDHSVLDDNCDCKVCQTYTKSYLRHLFKANEHLGPRLISYHNLYFLKTLTQNIRQAIKTDTLLKFKEEFFNKYYNTAK